MIHAVGTMPGVTFDPFTKKVSNSPTLRSVRSRLIGGELFLISSDGTIEHVPWCGYSRCDDSGRPIGIVNVRTAGSKDKSDDAAIFEYLDKVGKNVDRLAVDSGHEVALVDFGEQGLFIGFDVQGNSPSVESGDATVTESPSGRKPDGDEANKNSGEIE